MPHLFNAALKMLSVPATSVLSEQVFSGAGNISCKQRSRLNVKTIEQLVLLQRSIAKEDIEAITAEDFREERRRLDRIRKERVKKAAYEKAFEQLESAAEAAENAYVDGNDDQMMLAGSAALAEEEVFEDNAEFMDIDDALEDINEVPVVESMQEQIQAQATEYKMLTRRKLREITNGKELNDLATGTTKRLTDFLAGGLD